MAQEHVELDLILQRGAAGYTLALRAQVPGSATQIDIPAIAVPGLTPDDPELLALAIDPLAYGTHLSAILFTDPHIRSTFVQARSVAETRNMVLRIRLSIAPDAPELHNLSWETLHDPERGGLLCTSERIIFSRYLSSNDWRAVQRPERPELRALVAIANPHDLEHYQLAPIDVAGELARARAGLGAISTVELASGGQPMLNAIVAGMRSGCEIVYLVCHGALIEGVPRLWLEDAQGNVAVMDGRDLAARVRELTRPPLLAVLISCQSGGTQDTEAQAALGPLLAAAGVPAVLAMQGNVSMATMAAFVPRFFEELQRDGQIDQAVAVARGRVRERLDAWMPVLWMRLNDGHLWTETLETRYLTDLITRLERRKGVLNYVALAGQADVPEEVPKTPHITEEWGLDLEFALLEAPPQPATPAPAEGRKRSLGNILEVVQQLPRFVLIGDPGAGKTTSLERLVLEAARARLSNSHAPLPMLLRLPLWRDEPSPAAFIRANWSLSGDPLPLLARGEVCLYLDGLNEMGAAGLRKARLVRDWLKSQDAPQRVVITCRQADYTSDLALDLPTVVAEQLDDERITQFATHYLGDSTSRFLANILPQHIWKRSNPRQLIHLARNPYLLTALLLLYRQSPSGDLPRNTGALFQRLIATLWERERERQTTGWVPLSEMKTAFARLAFVMIDQQRSVVVPEAWAARRILGRRWWQPTGDRSSVTALFEAGRRANMLTVQDGQLQFSHQLVQEYFAAVALAGQTLAARLHPPRFGPLGRATTTWDAVMVALCGIVPESDSVIQAIATVDPFLAAKCVASGITIAPATHGDLSERLQRTLHGRERDERQGVVFELRGIRNAVAVPGLIEVLHDPEWHVRQAAAAALRNIGDAAVPGLIEVLSDPEWHMREAAAAALGEIGDAVAVPELLEALHDPEWHVRQAAAMALWVIGDVMAVPGLLEALRDPECYIRGAAAGALGKIGDAAAVPELLEALRDLERGVRLEAAGALGKIGDATAVPGLVKTLRDLDELVSGMAVAALGMIGKAAVPELLEALRDQEGRVRQAAAEALGKIGDVAAVPGLLKALRDWKGGVRQAAAEALGKIGDAAAMPGLLKVLRDPYKEVREAAASALDRIEKRLGV